MAESINLWSNDAWLTDVKQHYMDGYQLGTEDERKRITDWIDANREEITPGVYRTHFTSESLMKFINEEF